MGNKILAMVRDPKRIIYSLGYRGFFKYWSGEKYLKMLYHLKTGEQLDLENPLGVNEKMQWLKLYYRNADYVQMADKYAVRQIIRERVGEKYLIPIYGVFANSNEIDIEKFPNSFVAKTTHDSGGVFVCKDKHAMDVAKELAVLDKRLRINYEWYGREWYYGQFEPKIIVEKYLTDESGWELKDYKIFCFNGEPKLVEVDYNRFVDHKLNVYDLDWNYIDFYMTSRNDSSVEIKRPENLDVMLEIARKLATNTPFMRVDLYSIKDKIYCGELTMCPGSGFVDFQPREWDRKLGDMLVLPEKNKKGM